DLVEIALIHLVKMCRRSGANIAHDANAGSLRPLRLVRPFARSGAPPRQQPLRRNPKAPCIALGLVRPIVAAPRRFPPLVRAVGGNRDAHGLACGASGLEMSLTRDA